MKDWIEKYRKNLYVCISSLYTLVQGWWHSKVAVFQVTGRYGCYGGGKGAHEQIVIVWRRMSR